MAIAAPPQKAKAPVNATPASAPLMVQRQAEADPFDIALSPGACACGGGCPRCAAGPVQAKLAVSQPSDPLEIEADRVAEAVTSDEAREAPALTPMQGLAVHRACACGGSGAEDCACDEGEALPVQRSAIDAARAPPASQPLSFGAGEPLPAGLRADFEPRFGRSFAGVRVHRDSLAAASARALHSLAYTVGSDIAFGAGQYVPGTSAGRRLIAHELAHVVQQSSAGRRVDRMTYGTGSPPVRFNQYNGRVAPAEERERVTEAIDMVREAAHNRDSYVRCNSYFWNRCPGGTETTFREMFDKAILWRADKEDAAAFTWPNTDDIAYTEHGYDSGARSLAATLVHELMHNCGITGDELHHLADVGGLYCIGPASQFSIAAGPAQGADYPWLLYSYRRLLTDIGSGQLQLRAGADLNVFGISSGIERLFSDEDKAVEYGSLTFGARLRGFHAPDLPPREWPGGERFGGLTTSLDIGASLGHFRVRDAGTEFLPGFIIQGGVGAEFYLPIGVNAVPLSVEAIYRFVQPLNPEAERMHGWLISAGLYF